MKDLLNRGYVIMPLKSFDKYMKGAILDEDINDQISDAIMNGKRTIEVHSSRIQDMDKRRAEYLAKEKSLSKCAELNNRGMAYEKEGKIALAIKTYEKNIELGYPARHSFSRLMILYKKNKDYENERRVIYRAQEVFEDENVCKERLIKIEQLINKEK